MSKLTAIDLIRKAYYVDNGIDLDTKERAIKLIEEVDNKFPKVILREGYIEINYTNSFGRTAIINLCNPSVYSIWVNGVWSHERSVEDAAKFLVNFS